MKKLAIAGASAVLAALPVVGVFATTGSNEFTDHLTVTVNSGCTLENGATNDGVYTDRYFSKDIAVGTYGVLVAAANGSVTADQSAGAITIKCNTSSGTVTVNYAATNSAKLVGGTASNEIGPLAATSGSTSGWAIKSNENNTATQPFHDYTAPAASGVFLTATASASGTTFNPSYQVYVAQGQAPDTYTGSVTYTISYN